MSKAKNKAEARRLRTAREALIKGAIYVLKGYGAPMAIGDLVVHMRVYDQGRTTGRALSAALRVARARNEVTYDGQRYGLPVEPVPLAVPAWVKEGQRVEERGGLKRVGNLLEHFDLRGTWLVSTPNETVYVGSVSAVVGGWRPIAEPTPAPGAARDLAERQAFAPTQGSRTSAATSHDVDPADKRAPVPTEAAERIAELERQLTHAQADALLAAKERDEARRDADALRGYLKDSQAALALESADSWQKARAIRGLIAAIAAMAERTDAQAAEKGMAA